MPGRIPYNRPHVVGRELEYIARAIQSGNAGGDGEFTKRCETLLQDRFGIERVLLTNSCTASLEIAMLLCDLEPGDEVLLPSFAYVSAANAVVRAGGRPVFVDIREDTLNIDEELLEAAVTERTRAVIVIHYAGVAAEMDRIQDVARRRDLFVAEDAAQAVNASYRSRALGSIGDVGCFSFHETKNFHCGQGGALCINRSELIPRASFIRHRGTNRQEMLDGRVARYEWVALGSAYALSEIQAAFLLAQLEEMESLSAARSDRVGRYRAKLEPLEREGFLRLPHVPAHCRSNDHLLHLVLPSPEIREGLRRHLVERAISAVTHFEPLHSSPYAIEHGFLRSKLPVTDRVSARILRVPLFYELSADEIERVVGEIAAFFHARG
ncbi:MAG: dTDP-4-amino-4,6-dideoxygalactose transaminase [Myxococcota bacterium]